MNLPLNSPVNEAVLSRIDQPIAYATGLPNECYTTHDAFVRDRDAVMTPGWVCVGFIDQLDTQNFALPVDFMGLPLVITRDSEDVFRVFHNVCSHRGMHLTNEPCKNNGLLRCPYHNWTYALDGTLRGTPHIGGYGTHTHPDFNTDDNGLKEVRSAVWLGAVFINLSGDAEPFETYTAPIRQQWTSLVTEEQLSRFWQGGEFSSLSLTVQSNWKLAVENFLESYHLPSVHPELNRISPLDQHYCVDYFDNGAGQGTLNYTRFDVKGTQLPTLDGWEPQRIATAEYPVLYPNTFFGIHADQLFILYLQPINQHETIEHVRIYYVDSTGDEFKEHRDAIAASWDSVFREDVFAVERMQTGRQSPAYAGGAFSPVMDEPTHHFHKWVARKLAASASRPE